MIQLAIRFVKYLTISFSYTTIGMKEGCKMILSDQPHVHYNKNQLLEVICQIRFPAILKIDSEAPARFQDQIRRDFPRYYVRQERVIQPSQGSEPPQTVVVNNHNFVSADGTWKINLTKEFFSISTVRYTNWEQFARKLDLPFAQFIQTYQPAYFSRIGLRYQNAFSREALQMEDMPWRDLIEPHFLGILSLEDANEAAIHKSSTEIEMQLPNGCYLKAHSGPGTIKRSDGKGEDQHRFILDEDLFLSGQYSAAQVAWSLQQLHENAFRVFRGGITQLLHSALEPDA